MTRFALTALVLVSAAAFAQEAPAPAFTARFSFDRYGDVASMIVCESEEVCARVDLGEAKVVVFADIGEIAVVPDDGVTEEWVNCRENWEEQVTECDWKEYCDIDHPCNPPIAYEPFYGEHGQ